MISSIVIGSGIGAFVGTCIATSNLDGIVHQSVKDLDNRINSSFKELNNHLDKRFDRVDKSLDIIKTLQLLDIYGAKRDDKGNVSYTAPDGSKIEYRLESNDVRTYNSKGELYTINGKYQPIERTGIVNGVECELTYKGPVLHRVGRTIHTKAGDFYIGYYTDVRAGKHGNERVYYPGYIKHVPTGIIFSAWMPGRPDLLPEKWYNRGKTRAKNLKTLLAYRKERHDVMEAKRRFTELFPELSEFTLGDAYNYDTREYFGQSDYEYYWDGTGYCARIDAVLEKIESYIPRLAKEMSAMKVDPKTAAREELDAAYKAIKKKWDAESVMTAWAKHFEEYLDRRGIPA
jgi:hypothetical protein